MVRLLLRKGADIAAKDDTDGETALHRAAEGGAQGGSLPIAREGN